MPAGPQRENTTAAVPWIMKPLHPLLEILIDTHAFVNHIFLAPRGGFWTFRGFRLHGFRHEIQ
jgi:hypothetical protein